MNMPLTEEAQEIIYACRDSIAPGMYSQTTNRRVTLDGIEMLVGHKPEQEAIRELVSAGLLRDMGNGMYYVVEFYSL